MKSRECQKIQIETIETNIKVEKSIEIEKEEFKRKNKLISLSYWNIIAQVFFVLSKNYSQIW